MPACSWGVITSCCVNLRCCFSCRLMPDPRAPATSRRAGTCRPGRRRAPGLPAISAGACAATRMAPEEGCSAAADAERLADVVVRDEHADVLVAQGADEVLQLAHRDGVDAGEGLVEEDDLGPESRLRATSARRRSRPESVSPPVRCTVLPAVTARVSARSARSPGRSCRRARRGRSRTPSKFCARSALRKIERPPGPGSDAEALRGAWGAPSGPGRRAARCRRRASPARPPC